MTLAGGTCPQCGEPTFQQRFCGACGAELAVPLPDDESPTETLWVTASTPSIGAPPAPRRSKRRWAAYGVAALVALGALGNALEPSDGGTPTPSAAAAIGATPTPTPTPVPTATNTANASPTTTPTAEPAPTFGPTGPTGPTGETEVGTVTRVVDGDTIRVEIDGTEYPIRYIGMDTPEPDAADPLVRQLADAATAANITLVDGRDVILERDISETDRFDRLLRNVWIQDGGGWVLVNLELVRRGFAKVSTYPPDVAYVDLLTAAQEAARTAEVGLWAETPTSAATPAALVAIVDDPLLIRSDERARFEGRIGSFMWTSLAFLADRVTVRWSVSASSKGDCQVAWQIQPQSAAVIKSTVRVAAGESETGNRRYDTPFADAVFEVTSTCGLWNLSMEGYDPAPATGGGGGSCDPSYPDVCIPPYPPDLDCGDITERRFTVIGADPHGFDGTNDGIGCESG